MGAYRVIDSGHWQMLTMPEEHAGDIISLACGPCVTLRVLSHLDEAISRTEYMARIVVP